MSGSAVVELKQYWNRSYSPRELVLTLGDAIDVVKVSSSLRMHLLGWECWLKQPDGTITHSLKHMGSTGKVGSVQFVEGLMRVAAEAHFNQPEIPNSELLFCLTFE